MAFRRLMFIFLISFFYVNCEVITENTQNSAESYSAEISAVLNYLNSTPVKVYNYKQGILLNAHKKADITELTLDVNVDCVNNYPDLPCTEKVLICNAFVRKNAEGGIQVLNDVNCKPKPEIIIDEPYVPSPTNATEVDANETKSIALSNEAVSSEVGEHFVAVRRDSVPCLGCPFDLNPNVEGVDELVNLALNHIQSERQSKQNAVKVLRLQQQVVNGVKYILLVEVAPKVDCSLDPVFSEGPCPVDPKQITVCQVTFIHKPWISKSKHIINNNCTVSQEFVLPDPKDNDVINEIDSNRRTKPAFVDGPNFDHIAETGAIDEMTPSRLEDLESQIMVELEDPVTKKPKANILELRIIDEIIVPSTAESEISANPVVSAQNEEVQNQRNSNDEEGDSSQSPAVESVDPTPFTSGQQIIINKCNAQDDVETQTVESTSEKPSSDEDKESKESAENRAERSIDSAGSNEAIEEITDSPSGDVSESSEEILKDSSEEKGSGRTKRAIPQLEKITPEEKGLVKNLADYVATALDDVDDDNHKRMVLQILGAKKMAGDNGVYYHMILRMGISHCLEDTTPNPNENCREKLFENYTKICKVQVHVKKDDFVSPKIVKSQCQNNKKDKNESNRTNYSRFRRNVVVGGLNEIDKDSPKVQKFVKEGVRHLDSQLNHSTKLKPIEVLSASSQVVAGISYRIKTKIGLSDCSKDDQRDLDECNLLEGSEPKVCEIRVWEKAWLNFRQISIKCDDDDKVYKFESNKEERFKRQLGGQIFEVSKNDESVQEYLEHALKHMDSESSHENKLKVQEILSAANQIVSGTLHRIKAKIVLSDCKKTDSKERTECGILKCAKPKICNFKIWDQPWLPNGRETNITCDYESHSFRSKREVIPGGQFEVSKDDETVKKYLEHSLKHMDSESSHENKLKIHEILNVTNQVVSGTLHRIKAKVVLSDCKKTDSKERTECGALEGAKPKVCNFKIWDQPWLPNGRETNITCDDETHSFRSKRDIETHQIRGLLGHNDTAVHFAMFNEFIKTFKKTYSKKEYKYRLKVFSDNMKHVRVLNTYEQGTAIYGVTQFADMTPKEFSKSLGLRMDLRNENAVPFSQAETPNIDIPTEFDWRKHGAVTEVKNQEQCGSCWAFSVTGNIEGQYAIKHERLLEFSEQELVDCDTEDQGCNGGLMDNAYRAIEKMGGLETEQDYPYDAEDEKCHFNRSLARVQLTGAVNISHNETNMAKWLVANGPISIAINANAMQFYMGGISHPFRFLCNPNNLDHGVLIVGYGVHTYPLFNKTLPYWIVKNSWGTSWGEQGYYRVYRGDGTCGLNQTPSSAIVA